MNGEDKIQDAINSLVEEVSGLRRQLEEEQEKNHKNQEEWDSFFREARLKNPITGETILSREDFYRFKEQELEKRSSQNSSILKSKPVPQSKQEKRSFSAFIPMIVVIAASIVLLFGYAVYHADSVSQNSSGQSVSSSDTSGHFVGSVKSNLIHLNTCNYAQNISDENRIYYKRISDALADGKTRCSYCLPVSNESTATSAKNTAPRVSNFLRRAVEEERRRKQGIKQNPNLPQSWTKQTVK